MIYLVDDQEHFLKAFKAEYGDSVRTFSHPNDALLALLSERPALLITDVFMPLRFSKDIPPQGMDGLKLAQMVKSTMPETQVVIISGNDRSEIEKKFPGQLADFKYFFNKPLSEDFHKKVKSLALEHGFTHVSLMLRPNEVERLKGVEGNSISEKVLNVIRRFGR